MALLVDQINSVIDANGAIDIVNVFNSFVESFKSNCTLRKC